MLKIAVMTRQQPEGRRKEVFRQLYFSLSKVTSHLAFKLKFPRAFVLKKLVTFAVE
jgi:hypothetical protein